jgi:hypothetical protein
MLSQIGVAVMYSTKEPRTVRSYILALWIADIGHLIVTCYVLGLNKFMDVLAWNTMAWGNIATTVCGILQLSL